MGPQGLDYPGTFELVQVQCFSRMFPLAGCDTNVVRKESRALRWWGSVCCMKVKIDLKHPLFTGGSEIVGEHWIHCKASLNLLFRLLSGRTAFHWANYDKLAVEPWWFGHSRKNVVHPVFGLTINDHESSLAHVPWLWKSEPFFFVLLVVYLDPSPLSAPEAELDLHELHRAESPGKPWELGAVFTFGMASPLTWHVNWMRWRWGIKASLLRVPGLNSPRARFRGKRSCWENVPPCQSELMFQTHIVTGSSASPNEG